ncbi:hypothetical protein COCOBI_13-4620 [Coccomyxa sp. Obi]|nr:hypothetical protein COCOBI_13-4620 [Coccomyxa sp. Obi]
MEVCCICHDVIQAEREAYAEPCFHRFHHECILRWSEVQLAKPLDDNQPPVVFCPLCKQTYASFIYDCRDRSYRRHDVLKQTSQDRVGDAASLLPSPAQRRRRSLYFQETAAEPCDDQGMASIGSVSGKARDGIEVTQLRPSLVERPAVSAWLRRELQALLMEEDVDLVAQHVLGTVRTLSSPASSNLKGGRPTAQKVSLSRAQWVEAVAAAAEPYIFGNAAHFAGQLWAFIASGMSVAAHDAAVFGTDRTPAETAKENDSAKEDGGPSQRHGWHTIEGSSSHSRGEDEERDVVSDDSGAYLPMVMEALRSTAASKSPAAAARSSAADSASDPPEEAGPALGSAVQDDSKLEGVSGEEEDKDVDLERSCCLQTSGHDRSNSLDCSWSADERSPTWTKLRAFIMGKLASIAFGIIFTLSVISWVIALAGNGALNAVCLDACRYYFGLSWWTIWFEFVILLGTIPVGILGMRAWKPAVMALLATNTALTMIQTDSWLQTKGLDPYYGLYTTRDNVIIAGYVLLSICNVLLIIVLGVMDEAATKITLPQQSAYSNSPPPHTVPTYPPRG